MGEETFREIGKSAPRVDAHGKVTGQALYSGDLSMPGMLHMKVLFAERPHARIKRLDASKAEVYPGVLAVFTARDVPVNEYGLQKPDQPVLCGPGSGQAGADVVRFVGDQIALIVAETEAAATEARGLVEIEFEDLPVVTDPVMAMRPESPLIHPERGASNICVNYKIRKGDVEAGFRQADTIVESEYRLPFQEHAYLQPEAGLAYIDEEGRVTVQCAGQWPHTDQAQIAHALGLPEEQVRVIYPAIGGAFGGREDMSVQIVLALAAWKLKRPVKIVWSRRESIIGHCKRHPVIMRAKWGATRAGKLVAAEMQIIADAGAYLYTSNKVMGNATVVCTGPYFIPHVKADTYAVYTNNLPTGAFRGFGAPQGNFIAEMQMNKLADALSMDPVEFRLQNALQEGETLGVGTAPPGTISIRQVIEAAAHKAGWQKEARNFEPEELKARPVLRGRGFAAGFKNIGFSFGYQENCWARVELQGTTEIERVLARHAGAEVGQGTHTVMTQMIAEAVGVPMEKVTLIASDTATMGNSGSVSASRMTFMSGNAIRGAAQAALEKWHAEERPAIGEYKYLAPQTTPFTRETGQSMPNFAYAYAAQAVDLEVDTETGVVRLTRVVCADDVGQAINPQLIEGQIEGAIAQAQGYALMENFQMKDGHVLTDQLSTYLVPTVLDIPDSVEPVIVEVPEPRGPWGARGVGEPPFLPLAPAILAAIHNATGIWMDEIPVTAERMWRALQKKDTTMKEIQGAWNGIKVIVVTVSDKAFRGERQDASGPLLAQLVTSMGAQVASTCILPDEIEQLSYKLIELADCGKANLILTTGGTGPSPRDHTPEATLRVIHREMPGLEELLRWDGYRRTPFAVLSRGVAGIRGRTLIVNLPGSPKAVQEGMAVLAPLLPSTIALIKDETPLDGLCTPQ